MRIVIDDRLDGVEKRKQLIVKSIDYAMTLHKGNREKSAKFLGHHLRWVMNCINYFDELSKWRTKNSSRPRYTYFKIFENYYDSRSR